MTIFPGLTLPVLCYGPVDPNTQVLRDLGIPVGSDIQDVDEDLIESPFTFYEINCISKRLVYNEEGKIKYPNHCIIAYNGDVCVVPMSAEGLNDLITEHILAHR